MERLRIPDLTSGLFSANPSKKVCRSLFGVADHDAVRAELRTELRLDLEERSKIWNFDFENFCPKGKENGLDWQAVPSTLGEACLQPGRSLVTSFVERATFDGPPTPCGRSQRSVGLIPRILCQSSDVRANTSSSSTTSPAVAALSPSKHTPFAAVPSTCRVPEVAENVPVMQVLSSVTEAKHSLEDADDSRVIKIVTVSPKRPGIEQQVAPVTKIRALRMSPRKANLSAQQESLKSPVCKRKRETQSNTIHDYMKQKKPRRVSLDCVPAKMAKVNSSMSSLVAVSEAALHS